MAHLTLSRTSDRTAALLLKEELQRLRLTDYVPEEQLREALS